MWSRGHAVAVNEQRTPVPYLLPHRGRCRDLYQHGVSTKGCDGIPDAFPSGRPSVERIALFHYVTKSLQDFQMKSKRGSGMGNHKPITFFHAIEKCVLD